MISECTKFLKTKLKVSHWVAEISSFTIFTLMNCVRYELKSERREIKYFGDTNSYQNTQRFLFSHCLDKYCCL